MNHCSREEGCWCIAMFPSVASDVALKTCSSHRAGAGGAGCSVPAAFLSPGTLLPFCVHHLFCFWLFQGPGILAFFF